ncbi:MAG: CvpA family protein [Chitinophagaceae bacterium]
MFLDIVLILLLIFACIKGFERGLIVALFSFIAILVGLAAAIKLSALVAEYLGDNVKISAQWLPVVSFVLVFILVIVLVRLGANLIQRTVEWSMLGWVNRLGGMLFYCAIVLLVYSVALFYTTELGLIKTETREASLTYAWVEPWGPRVMNGVGNVVPVFRDMFAQLSDFFGGVAEKLSSASH